MQSQKASEVVFDCIIRGVDKKIAGSTTGLVERILGEAGFEGVWLLKDSRRIRKKGRDRFSTIRIENRGGSKSIRIWCKPQGNDTAFEYSLYPPKDIDVNSAYMVLSRVHPATLQIPESRSLPRAVLGRLIGIEPIGGIQQKKECTKIEEKYTMNHSIEIAENSEESPPSILIDDSEVPLLALNPSWELWQEEAVDRALMAIAFVAEGGYAKKSDASNSIIKNLDIKGFSGGASDSYTSVEGSMRSLTMALWKRKRYIERITANSRGGNGPSESIRGYMITPKGERRLEILADKFGPEVKNRMNANWRRGEAGVSQEQASSQLAPSVPKSLLELKKLISSHDEVEKQIKELEGLVSIVDSELESFRHDMDSLDADITRINVLKAEIAIKMSTKEEEKKEWEKMKTIHENEKIRLEELMGVRTEP